MSKDITGKRLEEYNDVFVDIFNNLLFGGEEILKQEDLVALPTQSYVKGMDGKVHENNRDVRKADKDQNVYRLICGIENQSDVDNTMPERVMGYDYAAYEMQIKELEEENRKCDRPAYAKRIHDDQKLAPVITGVLHWGNEEWQGPRKLHDMIRFPKESEAIIKPLVPDYPMNLIEVTKLPKEVRERLTSDFRLIVEYFEHKKDMRALKEIFRERRDKIKHPDEFLDALSEVSSDKKYKEMKNTLTKEEKEELTMWSIADEFIREGEEKGRLEAVVSLVKGGLLKLEEAASFLNITIEDMRQECLVEKK